jgi:hypothetical protein
MDFPYNRESENAREDYLDSWYQQERTSERIGAILLIFASAVILVTERLSVADIEYKTLALALAVGFFSGGITLLFRSRRPVEERRSLNFLKLESHTRNANLLGVGAALLFYQANGKIVFMVSAGLMMIFSFWLHWRSYKIRQLDALFARPISTKEADE